MRSCVLLTSIILAVGGLSPGASLAQQPPVARPPNSGPELPARSHVLRGTVTAGGRPVRGADVSLLESLDYLLKPFGRDRLDAALDRVKRAVRADGDVPIVAQNIGMRDEIVMRDGAKILASRTRSRELRGLAI